MSGIITTYQRYTSGVSVMAIPAEEVSEDEGALLLLDGETDGFSIDATTYDSITAAAYTGGPVGGTVAVINTGDPTDNLSNVALDSSNLVQSGTSPKMVHFPSSPYVRWTPHNMCLQSQTFGTTWTPGNSSVTNNSTAAPDGTSTAETLTASGAGQAYVYSGSITTVASFTYTMSCYLKANVNNWAALEVSDQITHSVGCYFDLVGVATGANFTAGSGAVVSKTITSVGNGWCRCELTVTTPGTANFATVYIADADADKTVAGGASIYAWGAQLNRGPIATPYLATTSAARIGIPQAYDPVAAQYGVLVEPAATNICLRSEEFGTTWALSALGGSGGGSISSNSTTAPDGTSTADTYTPAGTSAFYDVHQANLTVTGTNYTFSVYAKPNGNNWIEIMISKDTSFTKYVGCSFNISTGATGTTRNGTYTLAGSSAVSIGNGWYRISITSSTLDANPDTALYIAQRPTDAFGSGYDPDDTSGVYLWGAQMESGSVATSYIPTLGSAVVRARDNIQFALASIPFSTSAGTLGVNLNPTEVGSILRPFVYLGTAANGTPHFILETSPSISGRIFGDAGSFANGDISITANTYSVAKWAFASGDSIANLNGDSGTLNTDVFSPAIANNTTGYLGSSDTDTVTTLMIAKLVYVPRRVTDGDLPTWSFT